MKQKENTMSGEVRKMIGAAAVIECLIEEGVEAIFGYPGGANMPIYDALLAPLSEGRIKHYLARHEQGAIHAAQGYARATGNPGVVLVTSGPGATNLITGIADAMIDSTPLICITGQVFAHLLGTDAFQEVDITGVATPISKWTYQVTKGERLPDVFAKAFYICNSGRPGPVILDITKNSQVETIDFTYQKCISINSYNPKPTLNEEEVSQAVALIDNAERPLALIGQGITLASAESVLDSFLRKTGIPAAATMLGLSALPTAHPNFVGMLGMHGNYAPNKLTNQADVILAMGMRFDDRVTGAVSKYAPNAKIIHIELDNSEVGKIKEVTVHIHADAQEALEVINLRVKEQKREAWRKQFQDLYDNYEKSVVEKEINPQEGGLTMAETLHKLTHAAVPDSIYVTDVGQHQMKAARYCQLHAPRSFITSGGLGTMGFGLPAAIGAQVAHPDRSVFAIIGDGGFQMTFQELGVVMEYDLPLKVLLLNNRHLGMVRQWQELFFDKRYSSTPLKNPNFQRIVSAYGIPTQKVDTRANLSQALDWFTQQKGAAFLEVIIEWRENVFPMIPTGAAVDEMLLGV